MKWKDNVKLIAKDGLHLLLGERQMPIAPRDAMIAQAMSRGVQDIELLKRLIAGAEGIDETAAAFGLAQFMIDYSEFIAPDTAHYVITN